MNRLQIKIMVWSFVPAATCACLQPLTKHWSIYAKAATGESWALFSALTFNPKRTLSWAEIDILFFSPRLLSVREDRFVSQTFANDVPHGYASFKHICNVIIGYVGGMNKSMLDLYKKLELQDRGEKREKNGLKLNFLSFPSLFFSLSLSLSLFHVNILLYLHKRSSGDRFLVSHVCLLSENKKPFFFTYDFTRSCITQTLEYFLSRPNCMQWSTLLSPSLRRLFWNSRRIVILI